MSKKKNVIIAEINQFVATHLGGYDDYYIGITNSLGRRIYELNAAIFEHLYHGEYTKGQPFYMAECESRNIAVDIEQSFQLRGMAKLNRRSRGKVSSRFIYCYKMTAANKRAVFRAKNRTKAHSTVNKFKSFSEFIGS